MQKLEEGDGRKQGLVLSLGLGLPRDEGRAETGPRAEGWGKASPGISESHSCPVRGWERRAWAVGC